MEKKITKPQNWLDADRRFKHWGKLVHKDDIDLSQKGGYALGGDWIRWTDSVAIGEGDYLIVACENGSIAHHNYEYRIVYMNKEGLLDSGKKIINYCKENCKDTDMIAKAENNVLFKYALWVFLRENNGL